jgi:NAD(P)-dependent dehydrogenase (short-subunit alcohol dehydrogenase family)
MKTRLIALVTGSSKGIGKAIVLRLLSEGYFVVEVDIDNSENEKRENSVFFQCDISKENEVRALFQFVLEGYGQLDLLVNNAGIIRDNLIWNQSLDDFNRVIDINLKGTWLMCKEAATIMKNQNCGRIVNIASRAWLGNKGQSNYSASKAGVISITRVLALELGKYNVLVNAIAPGLIDTPLTQGLREDVLEKLINAQPTKSIGSPENIAHAVSFLGSYNTKFITGQTLYVDGGKSIGAGGL